VIDQEANTAVRNLTQEAGTFLGLAFASYAPQLALVAARLASSRPILPSYILFSALFLDDLLTLVFALATMARLDLAGGIARLYRPWPTAKEVLGQDGPPGGIASWWFNWEDALFRRSESPEDDWVARLLRSISPYRQWPVIAAAGIALLATSYLAVLG